MLQPPIDKGVVFRFDQPWEGMASTYVTVIQDGSLCRMCYRGQPTENVADSVTCYAESKNGLDWVRPNLGLHEVQGTRNNNVMFVAVSPTNGAGKLLTKPLTFAGKRLTLNYAARTNGKLRAETNGGRTEKVMLDAEGPGCIVRFWLNMKDVADIAVL